MNDMMTVYKFDKQATRPLVHAHELVNHVVVQGLTLYNDGYRLRPCIVRGQKSLALDAPAPGETRSGYRPVAHGIRALQYAFILSRPVAVRSDAITDAYGRCEDSVTVVTQPWRLDSDPIHDTWTEAGSYEPDYHDHPDIWGYGY